MRKFTIIACAAFFAVGCSNPPAPKETAAAAPASAEKVDYAYLPDGHPAEYWEPGSQANLAMVLKSLKAFETGNVEECLVPWADSVRWASDGMDAKISKDSLRSMLKGFRGSLSSTTIKMNDYESVISKDKKEEYVTLWYKQTFTDKKGKSDSAYIVDDLKIENGKIVLLDEKQRKVPAKK